MCGNSDRAAREAQRAEELRKKQVADSTRAIDRAFGGGRENQLSDFVAALREEFGVEARRQKVISDRDLKFSFARSGLTGGSALADTSGELGQQFQRGLLKGERLSQSALADLRSADESSRLRLITLAQGGAGVTSSATRAADALRTNIESAQATTGVDNLGDIFKDTRGLFVAQQEAAARRRGLKESEVFASPFSRGS